MICLMIGGLFLQAIHSAVKKGGHGMTLFKVGRFFPGIGVVCGLFTVGGYVYRSPTSDSGA